MTEKHFMNNEDLFFSIVIVLQKRLKFILLGTVIIAFFFTIAVFLLPETYISQAVISFTDEGAKPENDSPVGIDSGIFNLYSNIYENAMLFKRFCMHREYGGFDQIDAKFFKQHITPIYSYDKKFSSKKTHNSILGIEIQCMAAVPQNAKDKVSTLGEYIKTIILNYRIRHYIQSLKASSGAAILYCDNQKRSLLFEISNQKGKLSLIENVLLHIPNIGSRVDREMVNVDTNTEKYLSPLQQLVAVKMAIKEIEIQIDRNERNKKIDQMLAQYAQNVEQLFTDNTYLINSDLLKTLISEKNKFFTDNKDDESVIAFNKITINFMNFQNIGNVDYAYISGPTLPDTPFKPKKKRLVAAGFLMTLIFFTFLAFFLEAWNKRKRSGFGS